MSLFVGIIFACKHVIWNIHSIINTQNNVKWYKKTAELLRLYSNKTFIKWNKKNLVQIYAIKYKIFFVFGYLPQKKTKYLYHNQYLFIKLLFSLNNILLLIMDFQRKPRVKVILNILSRFSLKWIQGSLKINIEDKIKTKSTTDAGQIMTK